ncbi:MAG: GlsB/YeaQ/YmgE family stress response membrane protein [Pseudomonadota bacterium]|jgi:uncharacterized membrane protein YeaQ/YmgE (transglycosylase-associated protein family)|nr:GlsB/YeaQ/YmgE family stress response membrane protein [Alphaproteobacteria bacterium]
MPEQSIGWLAAIIIGGLAGFIAEKLMKSDHGLLMNIILGITGAFVANVIFSALGILTIGWIGYLIAGVVGACLLIGLARMLRGKQV